MSNRVELFKAVNDSSFIGVVKVPLVKRASTYKVDQIKMQERTGSKNNSIKVNLATGYRRVISVSEVDATFFSTQEHAVEALNNALTRALDKACDKVDAVERKIALVKEHSFTEADVDGIQDPSRG